MLATSRLAIPYPKETTPRTDLPDIPAHFKAIATILDTAAIDGQGSLGSRPTSTPVSPGIPGRYYFATNVGNGQLSRDFGTGWTPLGPVPVVTALPGSPQDGDEIYLRTDAADGDNDRNVLWHLRYRATAPFTHKWECVGGPSIRNSITTDGVATGTDVDLHDGAGPQLTIPRPGVYDVDLIAEMLHNSVGQSAIYLRLKLNGATVETATANDGVGLKTVALSKRITVTTAGHIVKAMYGGNGASEPVFARHRELTVTPVRLS